MCNPYKYIGLARVIDKAKWPSPYAGVDSLILIEFDNSNPFPLLSSAMRFVRRNALSRELAQLGSCANCTFGEQSFALYRAFRYAQHHVSA